MKQTEWHRGIKLTSEINMADWLEAYGNGIHRQDRMADGTQRFQLLRCPFDESHVNGEAAIFRRPDGKYGFKCLHDSCADKTDWGEARRAVGFLMPWHLTEASRGSSVYGGREVGGDPFEMSFMDDSDFALANYKLDWLVDGWIVNGQNFLLAGPPKCLKTSVLIDLAISIASGHPFLGRFEVPDPAKVLIISGESGMPILQDLRRRIVESKLADGEMWPFGMPNCSNLLWSDKLPTLTDPHHLGKFEQAIRDEGIKFAVIDPAYLAFFASGGGENASNIMSMGPLLREFGRVGERTGCTLAIVHHFKKQQGRWREPSLADISLSGFAEWSRQWMMLSRPQRYRGGGMHHLYMGGGGPAAGMHEYLLHVNEGNPDCPLTGRTWEVSVEPWERWQDVQEAEREARAEAREEDHLDRVRQSLVRLGGERSLTAIREDAAMGPEPVRRAITTLVEMGVVTVNEEGRFPLYSILEGA